MITGKDSVLVTGGAGFIGSHLVKRLVKMGAKVIVIDSSDIQPWRLINLIDQIEYIQFDISNIDVKKILQKVSEVKILFHLAAVGIQHNKFSPEEIYKKNVIGTLKMLQLAKALQVKRFIYTGSCFEYGAGDLLEETLCPQPVTDYGVSKSAGWLVAESYYRRENLPVVSLRPFTPFGPFEAPYRLIPYAILKALDNEDIEITKGEQTRDFIFIDDLVDAFITASIEESAIGGIFNICTGISTSVQSVVNMIVTLTKSNSTINLGAVPHRDGEMWKLTGDPSKAREFLGWEPKTLLEDGIIKTINWFHIHKKNYSLYGKLNEQ